MSVEHLSFESPAGLRLAASLHTVEGGSPLGVAVVCHGMLSSRRSPKHVALCEALAERGVAALRFDFSGRGESEGRLEDLSYHRQVEELGAAAELARSVAPALCLVGSSMGGAVAILHAASDRTVAGVAGIAAVGRPGGLARRVAGLEAEQRWRRTGWLELEGGARLGRALLDSALEVDVLAAAGRLRSPLLLVHGERDEVVPLDEARELAAAAPRGRLVVLEGADHVFERREHRGRLVETVTGFVEETLRDRADGAAS